MSSIEPPNAARDSWRQAEANHWGLGSIVRPRREALGFCDKRYARLNNLESLDVAIPDMRLISSERCILLEFRNVRRIARVITSSGVIGNFFTADLFSINDIDQEE